MANGVTRTRMTFVVPFDGSELAEAALVRADRYGDALLEDVVAVAVVPERSRYAREKGWIDEDESYDVDATIDALRERVDALAPEATFEAERISEYPPAGAIADHVERLALAHEPTVVFLGSDNVGSVVTPLSSVAANVAAEERYDVYLVRHRSPPRLDALDAVDAVDVEE